MSNLRNRAEIDPQKQLDRLQNAIEEDKLYWVRNEAKIRASMTSQNYDEFRDIVAAAHLKPLDKTDKSKKTNTGWNKCVSSNSQNNE